MFFKKAKRIKELELKNKCLQDEIVKLRAMYARDFFPRKELQVEKYQAVGSYPIWFNSDLREIEIRRKLFNELYPFIEIEEEYDPDNDTFLVRASIRVVKER